jgi:hypothetical protein
LLEEFAVEYVLMIIPDMDSYVDNINTLERDNQAVRHLLSSVLVISLSFVIGRIFQLIVDGGIRLFFTIVLG